MPDTAEYTPTVSTHADRDALGDAAGALAGTVLRACLNNVGEVRVMLAAAPSQEATLRRLSTEPGIDWSRVTAFHMDDYLGLHPDAPQGFGNWLERHFVNRVPGIRFERMGTTGDAEKEAERYSAVLGDAAFDLVLLGLGVNGHLAFNDPPADFTDTRSTRVVALDEVSRRQQLDEGHFPSFEAVPTHAITVTVPRLLNAHEIIASVPGTAKRQAVADALDTEIDRMRPGTALRTHPRVSIFLDRESSPQNANR